MKNYGFVVIASRNLCGKLAVVGLNSANHPWALTHGQSKFMMGFRV
jgi:hypothetical protein